MSNTGTPGVAVESQNASSRGSPPPGLALNPQQQATAARDTALQQAELVALKAELKRLREENVQLRKMAEEFRKLEKEVEYLRGASLMQHEEKVPIRLRMLEQENLRLRKLNTSLEERLRTLESEDYRQRMVDHLRFFHQDYEGTGTATALSPSPSRSATKAGGTRSGTDAGGMGRSLTSGMDDDGAAVAAEVAATVGGGLGGTPTVHVGQKSVVVIKGGTGPCTNCKFRLSVQQRAHEGEMLKLKGTIGELEAKLGAADAELDAVRRWVAHIVQVHQNYPTLAQRFPTTSISSPSHATLEHGLSPRPGTAGTPHQATSYLDAQRHHSVARGSDRHVGLVGTPIPAGSPPRNLYGSR